MAGEQMEQRVGKDLEVNTESGLEGLAGRLTAKIEEAKFTLRSLAIALVTVPEKKLERTRNAREVCENAARELYRCRALLEGGEAANGAVAMACYDAMKTWSEASKQLHTLLDQSLRHFDKVTE